MAADKALWQTINDDGPIIFYDPDFREVLEKHIPYFLSGALSQAISVEPNIAVRYEYDFYGLLTYYTVPRWLQWFVMRLNGMTSPDQYRQSVIAIVLPSVPHVQSIQDAEQTLEAIA